MLTKIPDYIISDCGYPNWDSDRENLDLVKIKANLWSTSSLWATKSTNFAKLLPLRETLSDYYMEKLLVMRQNESMYKTKTATTSVQQQCNNNKKNINHCGRQTTRYTNEVIKNTKRKQQKPQSSLDKRRSHPNSLDNDLDQF